MIKRAFDNVGRITIPKEYRDSLRRGPGDLVNIELKDNKIIISSYDPKDKFKDYLDSLYEDENNENNKKLIENIYLQYESLK